MATGSSTATSRAWPSSATGASCAPPPSSPTTKRWPGSARVPRCPSERQRLVARGDLAGEAGLGDLRHEIAQLGAAGDAQLGGQLVAAHERRLGPGGAARERLG